MTPLLLLLYHILLFVINGQAEEALAPPHSSLFANDAQGLFTSVAPTSIASAWPSLSSEPPALSNGLQSSLVKVPPFANSTTLPVTLVPGSTTSLPVATCHANVSIHNTTTAESVNPSTTVSLTVVSNSTSGASASTTPKSRRTVTVTSVITQTTTLSASVVTEHKTLTDSACPGKSTITVTPTVTETRKVTSVGADTSVSPTQTTTKTGEPVRITKTVSHVVPSVSKATPTVPVASESSSLSCYFVTVITSVVSIARGSHTAAVSMTASVCATNSADASALSFASGAMSILPVRTVPACGVSDSHIPAQGTPFLDNTKLGNSATSDGLDAPTTVRLTTTETVYQTVSLRKPQTMSSIDSSSVPITIRRTSVQTVYHTVTVSGSHSTSSVALSMASSASPQHDGPGSTSASSQVITSRSLSWNKPFQFANSTSSIVYPNPISKTETLATSIVVTTTPHHVPSQVSSAPESGFALTKLSTTRMANSTRETSTVTIPTDVHTKPETLNSSTAIATISLANKTDSTSMETTSSHIITKPETFNPSPSIATMSIHSTTDSISTVEKVSTIYVVPSPVEPAPSSGSSLGSTLSISAAEAPWKNTTSSHTTNATGRYTTSEPTIVPSSTRPKNNADVYKYLSTPAWIDISVPVSTDGPHQKDNTLKERFVDPERSWVRPMAEISDTAFINADDLPLVTNSAHSATGSSSQTPIRITVSVPRSLLPSGLIHTVYTTVTTTIVVGHGTSANTQSLSTQTALTSAGHDTPSVVTSPSTFTSLQDASSASPSRSTSGTVSLVQVSSRSSDLHPVSTITTKPTTTTGYIATYSGAVTKAMTQTGQADQVEAPQTRGGVFWFGVGVCLLMVIIFGSEFYLLI